MLRPSSSTHNDGRAHDQHQAAPGRSWRGPLQAATKRSTKAKRGTSVKRNRKPPTTTKSTTMMTMMMKAAMNAKSTDPARTKKTLSKLPARTSTCATTQWSHRPIEDHEVQEEHEGQLQPEGPRGAPATARGGDSALPTPRLGAAGCAALDFYHFCAITYSCQCLLA